jgi:hypothetical protein
VYETAAPYPVAGTPTGLVQRTPGGPLTPATGTYTGTVAIPAIAPPGAFGRNDPSIREQLGAEGVAAVLDYRSVTGEYPDLSVLFGGDGGGSNVAPNDASPLQLAGLGGLGGGLNMWILLSIAGLALLILLGPGGKRGKR